MLNTEKDGWEDNGQLMLSHQCLLSEPWDCSRLRRDWCAGRQESVFRKQMLYFILLLSLGDGIIRRRSGAVIWIWPMKGLPGRAWRRSSGGSWSGIFSYNIRLKNTINNIGKKKKSNWFLLTLNFNDISESLSKGNTVLINSDIKPLSLSLRVILFVLFFPTLLWANQSI